MKLWKLLASLLVIAAASFALAACGSSDEDKIEEAVTALAESSTGEDADGERVCENLTEDFLEEQTGEEGEDAVKDCEENVEENADEDEEFKEADFEDVDIDDDEATVKVIITTEEDGEEQEEPTVIEMKKEDGDWKIDSAEETHDPADTTATFE